MPASIFGSGLSGLNAAQMGLATTEHNIANLNTPGYTRQRTEQAARVPEFYYSGYIGKGVDVQTVKRVYTEFLDRQVLQEQTVASQLDSQYSQIRQIDNMLADPNSGMAPAIQEFFSAVNNVANSPESDATRQALINAGSALASRFQAMHKRLDELSNGVNSQITNSVTNINSYAKQIATLNHNIVVAQSANGKPANDLLDQRDQLVRDLNKQIRTTVVKQSDGSFNIFVGTGQSLVVGNTTHILKAVESPSDPSKLDIAYVNPDSSTNILQQKAIQGGELGGLLEFRDGTLTKTQNALGRVAMGIAGSFNEQHKFGLDLNGELGVDFFNRQEPEVIENSFNKGKATVSASIAEAEDYSSLTGSDYELKYNGGTSYTLTRLSDNKIFEFPDCLPSAPIDGITLSVSDGAVAGDRFKIRPTANASRDIEVKVSDPAKIAAAQPVRSTASLKNLGTGKISDATVARYPTTAIDPMHPATDAYLQHPVLITFNDPPDSYYVSGQGIEEQQEPTPYTPGEEISYNGWKVKITGKPAAGDTFMVSANTNATADGRNALQLASLQTANTLAGGTTSYQGAYSQIVSDIGNKTRELEVTSKAQASMVEQTEQTQQSISGVNMDEEAANLLRYQRAYQAAGKALQVANTMFDTILGIGR